MAPLPVDHRALRLVVDHRTPRLVDAARIVSHIGDPAVLIVLAVVVTALLWRRLPSKLLALVPLASLVSGSVIESVTKVVVGRPRPPVAYHLIHETDASFPSGHTTGTAALLMALALVLTLVIRSRAVGAALLVGAGVVAALVGTSRMILGVHWLTDVVAGWLLGSVCAVAVFWVARWFTTDPARRREPTPSGPRRALLEPRLPDDGPLVSLHL